MACIAKQQQWLDFNGIVYQNATGFDGNRRHWSGLMPGELVQTSAGLLFLYQARGRAMASALLATSEHA
jgi:hypothetical protein